MVRNSVCVEGGSGADSSVNSVAQSVIYCQIDDQVVETAVGLSQMLSVNASKIIRQAVSVESGSSTNGLAYSIAYGIVYSQIDDQIVETAVGLPMVLGVNALIIISHSVCVVTSSCTDGAVYGVSNGVVYSQIDDQVVETAVGLPMVLSVNALIIISHSVCIVTSSCTDSSANSVPDCVVYCQVDYKIIETTRYGVAEILCVKSLVEISVPICIETSSCTDGAMYGVPQGIVYHEGNNKVTETVRNAIAEILCVKTSIVIPYAVCVETCSCTDGSANGVSNGVVYGQINYKIVITAVGLPMILGVNACVIV